MSNFQSASEMIASANGASHKAGNPHFCNSSCFERNATVSERLYAQAEVADSDVEHARLIKLAEAAR